MIRSASLPSLALVAVLGCGHDEGSRPRSNEEPATVPASSSGAPAPPASLATAAPSAHDPASLLVPVVRSDASATVSAPVSFLGVAVDGEVVLDHPLHHRRARIVVPSRWKVEGMNNGMSDSLEGEGLYASLLASPLVHDPVNRVFRRDAMLFLTSAGGTSDVTIDGISDGRLALTAAAGATTWGEARRAEVHGVAVRVRRGRGTLGGEPASFWQIAPVPGTDSTALVLGVVRDAAPTVVRRELIASLASFTPR